MLIETYTCIVPKISVKGAIKGCLLAAKITRPTWKSVSADHVSTNEFGEHTILVTIERPRFGKVAA